MFSYTMCTNLIYICLRNSFDVKLMMKIGKALIFLLFAMNLNAQEKFYLKCLDADNLHQISNVKVTTHSSKTKISYLEKGCVELVNFKKGDEIVITADDYYSETYQRLTKRSELVTKYNGGRLLDSGDTIVIELRLNAELLNQRWNLEDAECSKVDTANICVDVDSSASCLSESELGEIINSRIHFPRHVIDKNIQGSVVLSMIVEVDGSFSNVSILKSLEKHLDRIALRALRSKDLPKWNPAMKDSVAVRSKIEIPINFHLN